MEIKHAMQMEETCERMKPNSLADSPYRDLMPDTEGCSRWF